MSNKNYKGKSVPPMYDLNVSRAVARRQGRILYTVLMAAVLLSVAALLSGGLPQQYGDEWDEAVVHLLSKQVCPVVSMAAAATWCVLLGVYVYGYTHKWVCCTLSRFEMIEWKIGQPLRRRIEREEDEAALGHAVTLIALALAVLSFVVMSVWALIS